SPSPSSSLKPLRQLDVFQVARDARALTESVQRAFPERQVPVPTHGQLAAQWNEYIEELNSGCTSTSTTSSTITTTTSTKTRTSTTTTTTITITTTITTIITTTSTTTSSP